MNVGQKIAADLMDEACLPEVLVANGVDKALRERIAFAVNRERDDLNNAALRSKRTNKIIDDPRSILYNPQQSSR